MIVLYWLGLVVGGSLVCIAINELWGLEHGRK